MLPDEGWNEAELSEEDLDTLDAIWTTSSGRTVTDEAITSLEPPERPTVAAAEPKPAASKGEPSLEEIKALLEEESGAGVFPWRSASREQIRGQWQGLREFVEWIVVTYRLSVGSEHNPCWWRHPGIVQEWVGLWHLYDLSWSEEDSGAGPNNFNYWLQAGRMRLHSAWNGLQGCTPHEHKEPRPIPDPTQINDEEWEQLTGSSEPYKQPEQWPTRNEQDESEASQESTAE